VNSVKLLQGTGNCVPCREEGCAADRRLQLNALTTREKIFKLLNLSVPVLMGISIFLNPFPHTTALKEACFYGSAILTILLACLRKKDFSFKSPLTLPFALFSIWVFIGLFFALDKEGSIHDFRAHLLKYMVFYYILINYFNSSQRLNYLSWIFIFSAAIFSTGQIVYFYAMLGNALSTPLATGISEVPVNWIGFFAVPAAIFSFRNIIADDNLRSRIASLLCLLPISILCFLTQTRSTVLALFLSVIILCFKNKKILVACLGILFVATAMSPVRDRIANADLMSALRLDIHYTTWQVIKDFPIMGIGFGMESYGSGKFSDLEKYNKRVPEKYRGNVIYPDPHSMPFSIAVRTGLIGLAFFLNIFFVTFMMGWRRIRQGKDDDWARSIIAAVAAVLVIGFFEPSFSHVPEVVFYSLLAMMTIVFIKE
jgi:O-antigen ligase